jgi:hypothetical protein
LFHKKSSAPQKNLNFDRKQMTERCEEMLSAMTAQTVYFYFQFCVLALIIPDVKINIWIYTSSDMLYTYTTSETKHFIKCKIMRNCNEKKITTTTTTHIVCGVCVVYSSLEAIKKADSKND